MAVAVIASTQGSGGSRAITTPAAGDLIVVFISQTNTTGVPTITDSIGGTYTVNATSAIFASSVHSLYVGYKYAVGTETSVSFTPAAGGTAFGICCFEVSGVENPILIETIKNTNNSAFATSASTTAMTTNQNNVVLAAVALTAAQTPSAWTGSKPMTAVGVAATPIIGGSYIATGPLTAQQFTANWNASRNSGNLAIAIGPPYVAPATNNAGFFALM